MMKNSNKNNILDERQMQIRAKSVLTTLIFVLACLVAATVYRVWTTDEIGWEFWVLIGACFVMAISQRIFGDIEAPKDLFGKPLPLGNSKEDRRARKKDYFLDGLIFGAACAVMDIILILSGKDDVADMDVAEIIFPGLDRIPTVIITAIIAFVSSFIIAYTANYFIGEKYKVKRYNDLMAKLDAEEDEDE